MTVQELIKILQECPQELTIYISSSPFGMDPLQEGEVRQIVLPWTSNSEVLALG